MGSVELKRVKGVARFAIIAVAVAGVMPVFEVLVRRTVVDDADRYLAGETSTTEFTEAILGYGMVGLISGLATIVAAVLTIIWTFRVAKNLRTLQRGTKWGPGWAIGGWFAPPMVCVIPALVLNEQWKASDPDVAIGQDWRARRGRPLPLIWFLLFSVPQLIGLTIESGDLADQFSSSNRALAEQITGDTSRDLVLASIGVVAAAVFIVLVNQITSRHRRLTGEANA